MKDIIIVVRDQLDYIRECVTSLFANTTNFRLYLWDNGSAKPTRDYLKAISVRENVFLKRSSKNLGFIEPNNQLAKRTRSPYLILLNSDTRVSAGWDRALIGYLQAHPEVGQVGYMGGVLDEAGKGCGIGFADQIDYLMGWCVCQRREWYESHGLFDNNNLQFAYFEDADLSLRIRESGQRLYALTLDYVFHHGNATIKQVRTELDISTPFQNNQRYFRERWADYLAKDRLLNHLKVGETARTVSN